MPDRKKARGIPSNKPTQSIPALSLKIETTDSLTRNVNVDDFLKTAEKLLGALIRATTVDRVSFEKLAASLDVTPRITEVDGSGLFCEFVVP